MKCKNSRLSYGMGSKQNVNVDYMGTAKNHFCTDLLPSQSGTRVRCMDGESSDATAIASTVYPSNRRLREQDRPITISWLLFV